MLQFKPIKLEDANVLNKYLGSPARYSCESTLANLIVWSAMYDNMYAESEDMLFIKSGGVENESFRLPFGENLEKGIEILKNYTKKELPLLWVQQGERYLEFKVKYGDKYVFIPDRDACDYIYLQEDLAKLSGKKYHSKRNHISSFSKKYDWCYRDITDENISDVTECMEKWYSENSERFDRHMKTEKQGIYFMLENMKALGVRGGAIYVNQKVVAFTLGSPVNRNVFDVHVEKALDEYATAYTVINNEFAKRLNGYKYINREDDLGIEGLRKAKLSYKPHFLLKKFLCLPKKEYCKSLYHVAFGQEDNSFEDNLFEKCFEHCRYIEKDDKIVSMCFALPCKIGERKAKYIFAVTTDNEYRGQGFATKLIEKIKAEDDSLLILRPANESLIPFYERMGFVAFTASNEGGGKKVEPTDTYLELAKDEMENSGCFTAMVLSNKKEKLDGIYFPYSMP